MWDTLLRHPRGRISQRYLLLVVTGFFVAIFACLGHPLTAFAEDAYRIANGIHYDNKDFTTQVTITKSDPRKLTNGSDVYAYEYTDPAAKTVEDIYFASQDGRQNATTGEFVKFTVVPPNSYTQDGAPKQISIAASEPNAAPVPSAANASSTNTCNVDGIGWIICPVTGLLAKMLDGIYGVLMDFLDVQPMLQSNPIFDIWSAIKNIANICFVIVFMFIIFSQVTTIGLSNYGIKKMIPRLIIAAILVNLSYWICALGVDLSNFLGHSVYAFLMSFAESLDAFKVDHITWEGLANGILGATAIGGTVAGFGLFSVTTAGSLPAALFTLLGMLLSVILAAITALFILMARQALIIVFILVSPLAFVAMVLPKTEKWFDKWKDTFIAMLIMFPLFSLVFGGAVLAGAAIIVSAHNNIFLILLGKGTQLMPLAITPLIVKFSTGALGTVAGLVNNRNKGLMDRARKWTDGQAEYHRKKSLRNNSTFGKFNLARDYARWVNNSDVAQKRRMESFDSEIDSQARSTRRYRRADLAARRADQMKTITGHNLDEAWNDELRGNQRVLDAEMRVRIRADAVEAGKAEINNLYDELRAGADVQNNVNRFGAALANEAYGVAELTALNAIRKGQASHVLQSTINSALLNNGYRVDDDGNRIMGTQRKVTITDATGTHTMSLQDFATGIGKHELMLSTEVAKSRKEYNDNVNAMAELAKHYKLNSQQYQDLAATANKQIEIKDDNGHVLYTFSAGDEYAKEAAIEHQFKAGSYGQKMEIIKESGGAIRDAVTGEIRRGINYEHRSTIQDSAVASGISKLAPFINDLTYDAIIRGDFNGDDSIKMHALRQVYEGRIKVDVIAGANDNALGILYGLNDRDPNSKNKYKMDAAEFNRIKTMYLNSIDDDAKRAEVAANFDQTFTENYTALKYNAATILDTPTIARDASENSRKIFEQYREDKPKPPTGRTGRTGRL